MTYIPLVTCKFENSGLKDPIRPPPPQHCFSLATFNLCLAPYAQTY